MKTSLMIRLMQHVLAARRFAVVLLVFLFAGSLPVSGHSGHTDWGPWSFDWEVKDGAGIAIRNVYYKHELVIYKANMPVIRVRYDGNASGPWADRIDWGNLQNYVSLCTSLTYGCGTKVCQKSYWIGSRHWLEIGVYATLGSYRLYPAWQLSEDGYIMPRLWSAGLQAPANHVHHPYWRIDFDVNGAASDQVFVYDSIRPNEGWGPGWHKYTQELNAVKNPLTNRRWYVRDNPTGHGVWIIPGPNDGFADLFSTKDVAPRLYHYPDEGVPWPFSRTYLMQRRTTAAYGITPGLPLRYNVELRHTLRLPV